MSTTLPSWLEEIHPHPITSTSPSPSVSTALTYRELQFENLFATALDRLSLGHQLIDICDDDPRGIHPAEFLKWIKKDKTRYAEFKESQELAAEFLVYAALKAANGNDSLNDSNRDKLIVDTSLKIAGAWSPKRYGKEQGMLSGGIGGGGITINIGQVESPYVVDSSNSPVDDRLQLVSDVEVKDE